MNSMTGFGRGAARFDGGEITCELRSVNHRYLDIAFRLPDALRALEGALRDRIRERLARGRLEASFRLQDSGSGARIEVNAALVDEVAVLVQRVRARHPDLAPPTVLDLLRWPGAVVETPRDESGLAVAAGAALDAAIDALDRERIREGAALALAIGERLDAIETIAQTLRTATADLTRALRDRIRVRLDGLAATVDADRLAQEVALAAQRADVAEELDRLTAHLAECRTALSGTGPVGRRLDFLAQELNREANTLSSKAASPLLAERAVELKVQIEQVREQVQNVE